VAVERRMIENQFGGFLEEHRRIHPFAGQRRIAEDGSNLGGRLARGYRAAGEAGQEIGQIVDQLVAESTEGIRRKV